MIELAPHLSSADGDQQKGGVSKFYFNAKSRSRMGSRSDVCVSGGFRDARCDDDSNVGFGAIQAEDSEGLGSGSSVVANRVQEARVAANCNLDVGQQVCCDAGAGSSPTHRHRASEGTAEVDRMEFEGGGDVFAV